MADHLFDHFEGNRKSISADVRICMTRDNLSYRKIATKLREAAMSSPYVERVAIANVGNGYEVGILMRDHTPKEEIEKSVMRFNYTARELFNGLKYGIEIGIDQNRMAHILANSSGYKVIDKSKANIPRGRESGIEFIANTGMREDAPKTLGREEIREMPDTLERHDNEIGYVRGKKRLKYDRGEKIKDWVWGTLILGAILSGGIYLISEIFKSNREGYDYYYKNSRPPININLMPARE